MDCKRVRQVVFLFTDNEMDDELLGVFSAHLGRCPDCAQHIDFTRKLVLMVRMRCVRVSAPERLRSRILNSLPHRAVQLRDQ